MSNQRLHRALLTVMGKQQYWQRMRSLFGPSSVIAYWPLEEVSGTVARDVSGNERSAAYSAGADLANTPGPKGNYAPYLDGSADFVNIYSASLASAFSAAAGTVLIWCKVSAVGDWNDSATRIMARLLADGNNFVDLQKTTAQNSVMFRFRAGGAAAATVTELITPYTTWFSVAMTWERGTTNEMKAFVNGVQLGTTQTISGTWSGSPAAATTALGASSTSTPASLWKGWLAHAVLLNRAATPDEILQFHGST